MRRPSIISEYLDELSRELRFDLALAQRVREEIEDHLWETVAGEPKGDPIQAQLRATERFGDPADIAEQFPALSLLRHTKRVGAGIILLIAGVFIAMQVRVASYAPVQLRASAHIKVLRGIAFGVDRWTFLASLTIGIIGWAYIASRRAPVGDDRICRGQIRCYLLLSLTATCALTASVVSDAILTETRLAATGWSISAWIPLLIPWLWKSH